MEFKSPRDILNLAIAKERASERFYEALAAYVKRDETASVFALLAREEQRHSETIQLELLKQGYTVHASPPETKNDEEEDDFDFDGNQRASRMTYVEALRLGVQKEQAAFTMYAELMTMVEEPDTRQMLLELAKEEMRHLLRLEREIQAITGTGLK